MSYFLNILIYLIIFYMGVVVFAYLNYVITRLPKKESITGKLSFCEHCEHEQKAVDVMPIYSFIRFRGKCRYCGEKINVREFVIQLLGGAFAVVNTLIYGITLENLLVFLVICDLTVITFIDIDTQEIPPVLNVILFVLGVASIFVLDNGPTIVERIIGLFCISVPMFILVLICNGFGGGDVKLMFAAGALLGWKGNISAFFIGAVLGGIFGIYLLATKKLGRKGHFAFGPFLSIGILISVINYFGISIIDRYIDYIKAIMS